MKKVDKKLIEKLKPYWKDARKIEGEFYSKIGKLERKMSKDLKIKDLELFMLDGNLVGIGNYDRTMKLIHSSQLEDFV